MQDMIRGLAEAVQIPELDPAAMSERTQAN